MKSLKQILISLIKEKRGYSMVNNPDSVWNRAFSNRKAGEIDTLDSLFGDEDGEGNDQQASGAEVAQKMGFDTDRRPSIHNTNPMSVMDVVFDAWDLPDEWKNQPEERTEEEEDDDVKPK
jgi:hypothetical protein